MKIKRFLKATKYRITGGSEYTWKSFGPNARWCDVDRSDSTCSCVYDSETQVVYQILVNTDDILAAWVDPAYRDAYNTEAKERNINPLDAGDGKHYKEFFSDEDIINIVKSVTNKRNTPSQTLSKIISKPLTESVINIDDVLFNAPPMDLPQTNTSAIDSAPLEYKHHQKEHSMQNYHSLLKNVLDNGTDQFNTRTGRTCRALVGGQLQYDLREGFPAITTKKFAFKSMAAELLGFFRGYDNAADFRALGTKIWDQNANETQAWLDNLNRKGTDDLGRIYGKQWTDWRTYREMDSRDGSGIIGLLQQGYRKVNDDNNTTVLRKNINQLENALRTLITNPSDRRIIISGWNPGEMDLMALPPCHMDYRFVAFEDPKVLHVVMTIRSWDLFLGGPFNIAETALFLAIMARLAGYEPGTVTIQATNVHIYDNHFEQVREQLSREHFAAPMLVLSDNIKPVPLEEVSGAFTRIEPADIELSGYESHAAIKAEMAA